MTANFSTNTGNYSNFLPRSRTCCWTLLRNLFACCLLCDTAGANTDHRFAELFCEGWTASLPGMTIRTHVFSEPQIVLVELAGSARRQSVIVNAESWTVSRSLTDPSSSKTLLRFEFDGGTLELPGIQENQTTGGILVLTGNAAKDIASSAVDGPFRVPIQCRGLQDQELDRG